jgi:hypothetical protein
MVTTSAILTPMQAKPGHDAEAMAAPHIGLFNAHADKPGHDDGGARPAIGQTSGFTVVF